MPTWTATWEGTEMGTEATMSTAQPVPVAPREHRWGWTRLTGGALLLALLAAGGLVAGTIPRMNRDRAVRAQAAASAAQPPRVAVATATRVAPDAQRVLPGNCL